MAELRVVRSELILGSAGSGKTARAEALAAAWLAGSPGHEAVYIATAQAWDEEMRERMARHRRDLALRVPRLRTLEEPFALAQAIGRHSRSGTLVVVDCLTLWLTAQLMPAVREPGSLPTGGEGEQGTAPAGQGKAAESRAAEGSLPLGGRPGLGEPPTHALAAAIAACAGPLVLISNEMGADVAASGRDSRVFVESLDNLNRAAAAACERVTLMSAGMPMLLKGQP